MTKKDFFRTLIKVFGLYSLITSLFSVLPSNIPFALYEFDIASIIYLLVIISVVTLMFLILIRNTDLIIKWLKLDQGFDDKVIQFEKFDSKNILKLAAIIIGGLLLIDNIPTFITKLYLAFKSQIARVGVNSDIKINLGIRFFNIILGYFLLVNFEKVSTLLKGKDTEAP
ncbi:MAG TPA: hypothetical protein VD908_18240 [Cytophagales bacterium]|nr:hypothetical protein [Cytophagales bacterium]